MKIFKVIVQDDANHLQLLQRLVVNTVFPEWITRKIRVVLISTDVTQEIESVRSDIIHYFNDIKEPVGNYRFCLTNNQLADLAGNWDQICEQFLNLDTIGQVYFHPTYRLISYALLQDTHGIPLVKELVQAQCPAFRALH